MKITEYIRNNTVVLDGGMGTLLQKEGLVPGELPERWNITHPDLITNIHRLYFDSGANVVNTNTFGANRLKLNSDELESVVSAAISNAQRAKELSVSEKPKWIALDIGPTGKMLKPYGDLDFEEAVSIFSEVVRLGVKHGADLIFIETMNDSYETKAALLAAKECSSLPVFVSNAYGGDGKLMTGADPRAMIMLLEGMGADAIGANCSLGPDALTPVIEEYLRYSSLPVILKPNAGLPRTVNGETVYDLTPTDFVRSVAALTANGVRAVGGCCGTTPEYISLLSSSVEDVKPLPIVEKSYTAASSYTHAVFFDKTPVLIGERINPTGKKKVKEALRSGDLDFILKEGIGQQDAGAHILDVNVGLPEIDETQMLSTAVASLQAVLDLPLQIDTADPVAMERALRVYNGKPMINSVNGKAESMKRIFPLVRKYGGLIVALTLDERGIPDLAEDRVEIAERILTEAKKYGIDKKDIIFDPLTLTVSADKNAAAETLRAVRMIRERLGCHTTLGVSNVSFGLPVRDLLNKSFFLLALGNGLSGAIMNPYSTEMMSAYYTYMALSGEDDSFEKYISFSEKLCSGDTGAAPLSSGGQTDTLEDVITKGLKDKAATLTREKLNTVPPMDLINGEIIPALNSVGVRFEEKKIYLPQLLMSAESAKAAFEVVKEKMSGKPEEKLHRIVIATVKGDIHDIGKNIVKLLMENYGFDVIDLGRDVAAERVVSEAVSCGADIVALSALMTTTVPAMRETVRLLRERAPGIKVMVGGAVVTEEYAREIGADRYAPDAMGAVRAALELVGK
ncbi:MAG: homocysteine S-methyltransferase family protein [Clostridia bacterium]|nr:homocysteine S-methyltransferase family protein [Clostridia bacterium]